LALVLENVIKKRDEQANSPERPKFADLETKHILGVGTFGRVKLVVHKPTGDAYALKCMLKSQIVAMRQEEHLMNEKRTLKMMSHPFILRLVQTYQSATELYLLEEVALGGELATLLQQRAPLEPGPTRFYSAHMVSIFAYMHSLCVVYRGLRSENLLLDKDGYLKLVDFGLAKIITDRTYTLCGTPEYLAPEIILNKGHGFAADWWTVGVFTFECLTGKTPFVGNGKDPMDTYRKIVKCQVPPHGSMDPRVIDFIDAILLLDPSSRLGCGKTGTRDVQRHSWYYGMIDWSALTSKLLPAPYVPNIKSSTDMSNFDNFFDSADMPDLPPPEGFERERFADFADEWV